MYVLMYTCTCTCVYVHMYTCMYMYMYIHVYMCSCVHKYTTRTYIVYKLDKCLNHESIKTLNPVYNYELWLIVFRILD